VKKTPSQPSQTRQKIFCDSSFVGHLLRREKQPERYEHWDDAILASIEAASLAISIVTIAEIRALWIAATASVRDSVLVTCDRDHVRIARDLPVEVAYLQPPV
jgi:predicted nucleic acid-binding protein